MAHLATIGGEPVGEPLANDVHLREWGSLGSQLLTLLRSKNGFYAYDRALLVRPLADKEVPLGILQWNAADLWRADYQGGLGDALFFAEDVFGGQYCLRGDRVCGFDPETAEFAEIGRSLEAWAETLLKDASQMTGHPLALEWQAANRELLPGERLVPRVPFVCGGAFAVDNLTAVADVEGMRFRASLANQIRNLPDGAEVVFKVPPDARPRKR